MPDRFKVRDWEVNEAIIDMGHDSYDVVGRDFPIGGFQADFFRYRAENYMVEAGFFYDEDSPKEEVMEQLEGVREVLSEEAFTFRLFRENADVFRPDYSIDLQGDYIIDPRSNLDKVMVDLRCLLPDDLELYDLSEIRCKR